MSLQSYDKASKMWDHFEKLYHQKGYVCYDPIAKKIPITRHVIFLEHVPFHLSSYLLVISQISFLPHFPSVTPSTPSIIHTYSHCRAPLPTIHLVSSQSSGLVDDVVSQALRRFTQILKASDKYTFQQWSQFLFQTHRRKQVPTITDKMQ